jgi:septal ring factor EnvC (AmiA/AmiB activator)
MMIRAFCLSGAAALLSTIPVSASADPNDYRENRANKVADCEKKLDEAQSRSEFREKAEECDHEIAKFDREWAEKGNREARERIRSRRYSDWDY